MYFFTISLLDGGGRCWSSVKGELNFALLTDGRRAGYSLESTKLCLQLSFLTLISSAFLRKGCKFIIQKMQSCSHMKSDSPVCTAKEAQRCSVLW